MADFDIPEYRVTVDQLRPGVFIRLEQINWFNHPFLFNNFKVKDETQIAILKDLGVRRVICVPEKSDRLPGKPRETPATEAKPPAGALDDLWRVKKERTRRLREKKQRIAQCEHRYSSSIQSVSEVMHAVTTGDVSALGDARELVDALAGHFLQDIESTLHLMNVLTPVKTVYYHALNTAVLSLMLGRDVGLDPEGMRSLGMGALFHDVGKTRIEKKILRKRGPLTRLERERVEQHPALGVELLEHVEDFPKDALAVVAQHHEHVDGSGYPAGVAGHSIPDLARIAAIANVYDNHCNHPDPAESYTPYQALSYMFTRQRAWFDKDYLALFIRNLGVYPPGTVVQLSNGALGLVISSNPSNQLRPSLVLYDPEIPKKEALVVDLAEEPEFKIEKSIRPAHLPPEIFDYLRLRSRITYYVDPAEG
ncbi:MAG: HD-GYP domain-containing protein [Desulfovibrionaceae bacterium]